MPQDLYQHPDYYQLDDLLSDEHKLIRDTARAWIKKDVSPIIEDYAQRAEFPMQIIPGLADIGAFGPTIPVEYGGGGLDYISYGILMQELERCDSGVRSTASVQGSLVMFPIYEFGSEEQRKKYLPKMATGEWMGCFGLTEPDFGSNPAGMVTHFKDAGDHVILNGAKMWISNSSFAQVAIVWAKDEKGEIHGLIVERGMKGFTTPETHGKWSLRASATGELVFDNVKVPKENLVGVEGNGFLQLMKFLDYSRVMIAGDGVGLAQGALEQAVNYVKKRKQFGKPLASFQVTQFKIAEMATLIETARSLTYKACWNLDRGTVDTQASAKAKWWACNVAVKVVDEALQLHGGYGYLDDYPIERFYRAAKLLEIYEGTKEIQKMAIGRRILGIG